MRIAYVNAVFPKLSETFVAGEIDAVRGLGHQVEVFAWGAEGTPDATVHYGRLADIPLALPALARVLPTHLRRHSGALSVSYGLVQATKLYRQLAGFRPDVIHAHFATAQTATALALGRMLSVPVTATWHADDYLIGIRPEQLVERVRAVAAVCCISESALGHVAAIAGSAEKLHVVRACVSAETFARGVEEPGAVTADGPPTLVCVARLVEKKGHRQLLGGLRRYLDTRSAPVRLEVIGDGPMLEELQGLARELDLDNTVVFRGATPHAEALDAVAAADAAILVAVVAGTGSVDGIPVFLMEAAAMGKPLASTSAGGIGELVQDGITGAIMHSVDPDTVADAIATVLSDAGTALGANAQRLVSTEFAPVIQAERLLAIWKRCVE